MKFRDFIAILEANGFERKRTEGSHRRYEGYVDGKLQLVTVAYHSLGDDILPGTLAAMIHQSGLPKKLFR